MNCVRLNLTTKMTCQHCHDWRDTITHIKLLELGSNLIRRWHMYSSNPRQNRHSHRGDGETPQSLKEQHRLPRQVYRIFRSIVLSIVLYECDVRYEMREEAAPHLLQLEQKILTYRSTCGTRWRASWDQGTSRCHRQPAEADIVWPRHTAAAKLCRAQSMAASCLGRQRDIIDKHESLEEDRTLF